MQGHSHTALPLGGLFIASLSLLFLDFHRWQHHANACNIIMIMIIYSFIFYFFPHLIKQLFSHETVKVSRLFCLFVLSWNCRPIMHNFITFLPFPKDLQCSSFISILTQFYILFWNLHCFLPLVLLWVYFSRFFSSYQWAECLCSTLAGFFLGGVHWQWHWTLLRIDLRVLGDILHSVMFSFLFLFLCNILT